MIGVKGEQPFEIVMKAAKFNVIVKMDTITGCEVRGAEPRDHRHRAPPGPRRRQVCPHQHRVGARRHRLPANPPGLSLERTGQQ